MTPHIHYSLLHALIHQKMKKLNRGIQNKVNRPTEINKADRSTKRKQIPIESKVSEGRGGLENSLAHLKSN
jgi:hypothetical protein